MIVPSQLTTQQLGGIVAEWAAKYPFIGKVWLFGSRVRGNAHARSDLDVAVALCEAIDKPCMAACLFHNDIMSLTLQAMLPMTLDLQWYEGASSTPILHRALSNCSLVVYESSNNPQV
ncbi:nucleotidyltransferase domain-containing protein [Cupriavidus pinatubonensis]|uniref:nucleotidyltransferase domain-containing protein n=1 Tax=Cupriavidus pinatubonensis TaxID=248026 RepID=UPI003CC8BEA9